MIQNLEKKQQQLELAFRRFEEAQQRYQIKLDEKVKKAREESIKAKEAQFIQILENQNKKLELEEKLLESQERKKDIEKMTIEKLQHKKQKDEEVRRKKREYEDEKVQKLLQSQKKKEEAKKKVAKSLTKTKKKNHPEILLDNSYTGDTSYEIEQEKRQFRSISPNLRPLESDQIVYFKLKKQNTQESDNLEIEQEKKRKHRKQKHHLLLKPYRESSISTKRKQLVLLCLNKGNNNEINPAPLSPSDRKATQEDSNNVTPKKEEEASFYRLCQICNIHIEEMDEQKHLGQKIHKQTKQYYGLMGIQNDIILIKGSKEEISQNRFQSIRKRCQKIKTKIQQRSLQLENINIYNNNQKEVGNSINKQRIQKLSNELYVLMNNQIKNLYQIETNMRELLKLINSEHDLINLRHLKFIQTVIEAFKKVSACHKNEYKQFLQIIDVAAEIVYQFCSAYNNRTYLIVSNKVLPIIDFMYSFLASKPTKFIYNYKFVGLCFQIFSLLIKHRLPIDPLSDFNIAEIQENTLEYIYCSGLFNKMKFRFLSFEKDYINSEGKIPLALVKSVAFIESATNYYGFDTQNMSIFDDSYNKIGKAFYDHIKFVICESELFGLIHLISQMIFGENSCIQQNKLLPQTIISFLMVGIKTLNNIARLNLSLFQQIMNKPQYRQETHMIMQSLIRYCKLNIDQSQDLKDLLNETILMIGYYCVLNEENQNSLVGSMKSISLLHNLVQMPSQFYIDKQLKNILFPTLLCAIFKNPINMQIVMNEMDKSYFIEMLQQDNELDQTQSVGMLQRSPSMSSTNSQNSVFPYSSGVYYKLSHRFPIQCFKDALIQLMEYND